MLRLLVKAGFLKARKKTVGYEEKLLNACASVVSSSVSSVSLLGAKNVVLTKFAEAVLPLLTATQCQAASIAFRESIEDVMAIMDDRQLPAEYHATLLDETNACIKRFYRSTNRG
jgi:hypothetical protein